jgi:peptidoglycan/xylan/chitin deacetylase (PgdA/CDA1 family)
MSGKKKIKLFIISILVCLLLFAVLHPSHLLFNIVSKLFPGAVYQFKTNKPFLALTIDDGPDSTNTPKILNTLSLYDARATFFLVSNRIKDNEQLVRRIVAEGHEIGNHLVRHDVASIHLSDVEFEKQLIRADSVLIQFSEVRWFRPGSGWYSKEMIRTIRKHGYKCVLGSIYPLDPFIKWDWFTVNYVLSNANPGSIIILHDGPRKGQRTARTLQQILPKLIRKGLHVVTISELINSLPK